jgi:hypothetical protein
MMQQNENEGSSNEANQFKHLPSGEIPTLILFKTPRNEWSEEKVERMKRKMFTMIGNITTSLSCLCLDDNKACSLCKDIQSYYKKGMNHDQKLGTNDGYYNGSGYIGCEDENLIIHFTSSSLMSTFYDYTSFELLSRARERLWLMMEEEYLNHDLTFMKTLVEMMNHDEQDCKNEVCKKEGWTKKKVLDIIYID